MRHVFDQWDEAEVQRRLAEMRKNYTNHGSNNETTENKLIKWVKENN